MPLLGLTPGFSATYTSTTRPRSSSISGTAAASAISSTVRHADSISFVPSRCPATLITSSTRPIMPIFTLLVAAVLLIVDLHKSLRLAPDRLKDAWPWVADANVAGPSASGLDQIAFFIVDRGVDPKDSRATAARLHRFQGRQGAAQEATVLGLPPGVNDDRFTLSDDAVIPAPDLRLNRLSHGCHVLEMVVVFLRLVGTELA